MAQQLQCPSIEPSSNTGTSAAPYPPPPLLTLQTCTIRPYHPTDAASIAHHGNNPLIAQWMTNHFPHPYTPEKAHEWIAMNLSAASNPSNPHDPPSPSAAAARDEVSWPHPLNYAITLPNGECIGSIGLKTGADVYARSAEVGYWLGEAAWGRGIATEATAAFVAWAFGHIGALERLGAGVYGGNGASARVLEKCGFVREGVLRRAVWKGGALLDLEVWGLLREGVEGRRGGEGL